MPVPPSRRGVAAPAPWSGADGHVPPPRPLARAWATSSASPAEVDERPEPEAQIETPEKEVPSPHRHPAVHGGSGRGAAPAPLFPRAGLTAPAPGRPASNDVEADDEATNLRREARAEAMRRHPSGGKDAGRIHVVQPGESLWAIAARHVAGDEAIDRCVDRIHALNFDVIGPNADLIHPGQRLRLPGC